MAGTSRAQLADDLLRLLAASLRPEEPRSSGYPPIAQHLDALGCALAALHDLKPTVVVCIAGDDFTVDEVSIARSEPLMPLLTHLRVIGVERVAIERGVTRNELSTLTSLMARVSPDIGTVTLPSLQHVRFGRIIVAESMSSGSTDIGAFQQLYTDAVGAAKAAWDSAATERRPDATLVRLVVEELAQAVSHNHETLLALTALRDYDNYTFTHMVNVSILTMAQARSFGVGGPLLREYGVAALVHDIGKVRTPPEILDKPSQLTPAEFEVMKRHTIDGAAILRSTPEMPALASVVALEHHLRLDGSGYPESATRRTLNLGTMLCSIADVYDAMRSHRAYQQAFPTDRILAVLQRGDGRQFDQHLVRRFAQLIGIYPVGNLVKLSTGEVAVVRHVHASDPRRPQVRVVVDRQGARLSRPIDVNLWEVSGEGALTPSIVSPLDPTEVGIDPLTLL